MINPPRSWNSNAMHYDKFHYTIDIEKYPDEKFYILGLAFGRQLEIVFIPHFKTKYGEFKNNALQSTYQITKKQWENDPFFFRVKPTVVKQLGIKKVCWFGGDIVRGNDFSKMKEYDWKFWFFTKPVSMKLQDINIKGILK